MPNDIIEDDIIALSDEDQQRIRSLAELADMQPSIAEDLITRGVSVDDARTEIRAQMVERSKHQRIRVVSPPAEDPAQVLERRTEALVCRVSGGTPSAEARPYMGDRLIDHARAAVERQGVSTRGLDADQIFERAMHGTSDFPQLLTGVGNRTLMPAYEAAASPLKSLARQTTSNDFRPMSRLKLSDTGPLQKLSEHGEVKHTTRGEAAEGYALDTYASMFALSRKALINDELGAFRDWGVTAGRAAAATEADLLWSQLSQSNGAGPVMGEDGKRLFHADHGNLAPSGGVPDTTTLSAARLALRTVKGVGANARPLGLTPKFIVHGPALETSVESLLASIYAASVSDVNPFSGKLTQLVEPRITGNSWYVMADPPQAPVLEYAYLAGAPGPQLSSREGWDVLGMEFRVVLDFGCGAVDWRGAYRNAGS